MCNHYRQKHGPETLRQRFEVPKERDYTGNLPALDHYPRRSAPVVRLSSSGERELAALNWGHPYYRRDRKTGQLELKRNGEPYAPTPTTNIRNPHYPMFRDFRGPEHRCLVPATSFAEPNPRKDEDGQSSEVWFDVTGDDLFAFAGIWRPWHGDWDKDRNAPQSEVFAFLTTDPNELVARVHPKAMPVVLPAASWEAWLHSSWQDAKIFVAAYPSELMQVVD